MLPKHNRLNIRTYFTEIRGTGKKLSSPFFSFYFRPSEQKNASQINVIVSKKVAKSAVKRNRMRRLINSALKDILSDSKEPIQGLFFVYKDYSHLKSQELEAVVRLMFKSGNILPNQ